MTTFGVVIGLEDTAPGAGSPVDPGVRRVVVSLWGEHDMASVPIITEALVAAADNSDADVLVDLTAVTFLDCSTVGVIVGGRRMLEQRSRHLTVCVSRGAVAHRLFELCGLDDMIDPGEGDGARRDRSVGTALRTWVQVPAQQRDVARDDVHPPDSDARNEVEPNRSSAPSGPDGVPEHLPDESHSDR